MRKLDLDAIRVASSVTARDINRRIILNLIRTHQPISRADLARQSGLQRSTVSAITEQLLAEHWICEGASADLPRGRKPTYLHLNVKRARLFGINIRPLFTEIVIADINGNFHFQQTIPTDREFKLFIKKLIKLLREIKKAHPKIEFEGIGVSVPGRVAGENQKLIFAPNLSWGPVDIKTVLESALGLPTEVENAANACALSALWFGDHERFGRNIATVTISEGVGVGLIINGEYVRGHSGLAGEYGHLPLTMDGPTCRCGNRGCWELYASNAAALNSYHAALNLSRTGDKSVPEAEANQLQIDDLIALYQANDQLAVQAVQQMAEAIGVGLVRLIVTVNPETILLVGEITTLWDGIEKTIHQIVKQQLPVQVPTRIVPLDHSNQPRLRGAIALILQKHFGLE